MKTKEIAWKKWIVAAVVFAVLVAGIVTGSILKKDKEVDLVVTAEDITIAQGESKHLEYKTSIANAVVRFRVRDTKIAEVEREDVLGKSKGETELTITARYKSLVYEKRIVVTVTEDNEEDPTTPENPPQPEVPNDNDNKEENPPVEEELEVSVYKVVGCEVSGKTIEMTAGKMAMIQVLVDDEYASLEIESDSACLTVTDSEDSQRMKILKATEAGEYTITFKSNNKKATFVVIVQSL